MKKLALLPKLLRKGWIIYKKNVGTIPSPGFKIWQVEIMTHGQQFLFMEG